MSRRVRYVALCIAAGFLLGSRVQCGRDPPTLRCDFLSLTVAPGECVPFDNPCGDETWVRLDGFRLCDGPRGVFVRSERDPRRRLMCAASSADFVREDINYYYTTPSDSGEGTMSVQLEGSGSSCRATVIATPPSIIFGASAQLQATAEGTPPVSYSWTPSGTLSQADIANPIATPFVSTRYTVTVTDANDCTSHATIDVGIELNVVTNAEPPSIMPGETSQLIAFAQGGAPPHTFAWSPIASLDDPTLQTPTASPLQTTTYEVLVTDSTGAQASGSVAVAVEGNAECIVDPFTPSGTIMSNEAFQVFVDRLAEPCVELVRGVSISFTDLVNLEGMERVTRIGPPAGLVLRSNDLLETLDGLESLSLVGSLEIANHPSLSSLSVLGDRLSLEGTLRIDNNDALSNLAGLGGVIAVDLVDILHNDNLVSLTGLENLVTVGSFVSIFDNDALTDLSGLNGLVTVDGSLAIYENDSLASLDGLDALESVVVLDIRGNASLTSVAALQSVTRADLLTSITITNNPVLSQGAIDALVVQLESAGFEGTTNISLNGP